MESKKKKANWKNNPIRDYASFEIRNPSEKSTALNAEVAQVLAATSKVEGK